MYKVKLYVILLIVLLILSLGALVYVLNATAPDRTGNIVLLFVILDLGAFAAASLLGFQVRKWFGQREMLAHYLGQATRQGLWLSLILVISLVLVRRDLFSWINAILLVLTFIFFESYLLTKNNNKLIE